MVGVGRSFKNCQFKAVFVFSKNIGPKIPQIIFHPKSHFFCELKSHAKFQNPKITPSGRKVERKKDSEKNALNSGYLVP